MNFGGAGEKPYGMNCANPSAHSSYVETLTSTVNGIWRRDLWKVGRFNEILRMEPLLWD